MKRTNLFFLIAIIFLSICPMVQAKVSAPKEAEPVVSGNIKYTAPIDKVGYVVAYDNETGEKLWEHKMYDMNYDPSLEKDVQENHIVKLSLENGFMIVERDDGEIFKVSFRDGSGGRYDLSYRKYILAVGMILVGGLIVGGFLLYMKSGKKPEKELSAGNVQIKYLGSYESSFSPRIAFNYPIFDGWQTEVNRNDDINAKDMIRYLPSPDIETKFEYPPSIIIDKPLRRKFAEDIYKDVKENRHGVRYVQGYSKEKGMTYASFFAGDHMISLWLPKDEEYKNFSGEIIRDTVIDSLKIIEPMAGKEETASREKQFANMPLSVDFPLKHQHELYMESDGAMPPNWKLFDLEVVSGTRTQVRTVEELSSLIGEVSKKEQALAFVRFLTDIPKGRAITKPFSGIEPPDSFGEIPVSLSKLLSPTKIETNGEDWIIERDLLLHPAADSSTPARLVRAKEVLLSENRYTFSIKKVLAEGREVGALFMILE